MNPDRHEVCSDHSGTCTRISIAERDLARQIEINDRLWVQIDKINARLNLTMGGVFVLWPILQIGFWLIGGKK